MNTSLVVATIGSLLTLSFSSAFSQVVYRMTDVGTIGGSGASGADMNSSGEVTGLADTADDSSRAFRWNGRRITSFGTFGGSSSFATGINDLGQITGAARTNTQDNHAFI